MQCCVITLITGVSTENVQMLRAYRAGASNAVCGKRTPFLKALTAEMREESAIFFSLFLCGKAK